MEAQEVIDAIIARAQRAEGPEGLDESMVEDAALLAAASAEFSSWAGALAAALYHRVHGARASSKPASSQTLSVAPPTRRVTEASDIPLFLSSAEGHLLQLPLAELACNPAQWDELPEGVGAHLWPRRAFVQGMDETLFGLGSAGTGGTLVRQHFGMWGADVRHACFSDRIAGMEESSLVGAFPRRQLRQFARLYAFSTDGQIKASEADEYAKRVGTEAIDVILPREGEYALTMFAADANAPIFVASSQAKAIVFSAEEVRSQGRKAQGMRAILLDEGAHAVSAFPVEVDECVLVTAQGYVKRMALDEFRPQGRGGAGLQTAKLGANDEVIAVLPTSIDDDLLLLSEDGRYRRFPVWQIPRMGRAARGEQLVAALAGDRIVEALVVPPGDAPA